MHTFASSPPPRPRRRRALGLWLAAALLLTGPALLVWLVRAIAYGLQCDPGPALCHGFALGAGFKDVLDLAWLVAFNTEAVIAVGIVAAIAALFARRPLLAGISALVLPLAALLLPVMAVAFSTFPGCSPNEGAVGDCTLWGTQMGLSFHNAAMAPWLLYIVVPYAFAAAIMLGLIGWLFCRERQQHS